MKIAVAGATGTVGTYIVAEAKDAGHKLLPISRSKGIDLVTGDGLDLSGVDAVIDASGINTLSAKKSKAFFQATTTNLLRAADKANVKHYVALSIVGAAENPYGYYAGKALQEELVTAAKVPSTILRSTQFFEFADKHVLDAARFDVIPKISSQPIAAATVARRLVDIATRQPKEKVLEIAGPQQLSMASVLKIRDRALGVQRKIFEIPLPGKFGRTLRNGSLLPDEDATILGPTCKEWTAGFDDVNL